jgi:hypothetical protein
VKEGLNFLFEEFYVRYPPPNHWILI